MTEIDLDFNPLQPRDNIGRWVHGSGAIRKALDAAEPGTLVRMSHVKGVGNSANDRVYTKRLDGSYDAKVAASGDNIGVHSLDQVIAKTYGGGPLGTKAHLLSPDDQRVEHNRTMSDIDRKALQAKSEKAKAAKVAAKKSRAQRLKDWLNEDTHFDPDDDKANPFRMPKKPGDKTYKPHRPGWQLSTPETGLEIDLDWTEWNRTHKKGGASLGGRGVRKTPAKGNSRAKSEIQRFKAQAGVGKGGAKLGADAMAELKRRAAMAGHLRAKAILAASRGHVNRANKIEAARKAKHRAKRLSAGL